MSKKLEIVKFGTAFISRDSIHLNGFLYRGGIDGDERKALLRAILDDLVRRINAEIGECTQAEHDEDVGPISMDAERDAEMEAYLLINRCQGNG